LLDAVAKRVIYTGGIGTGSIAKIMHNSASFTLDLVMAECWTTGVKAGIDATTIVKVFNEAALRQMMSLKVRLPATWLRGDFEPRFSLALARKELEPAAGSPPERRLWRQKSVSQWTPRWREVDSNSRSR